MKPDFLGQVQDLIHSEALPDREALERADRQRLRAERLESARGAIPNDDFDAIVSGELRSTRALRAVQHWDEIVRGLRRSKDGRPMRFLALLGPTSRGKTVSVLWRLAEVGGLYVSAPEFWRISTSRYSTERAKLEQLHAARFVVVDDCGTEPAGDEIQAAMFDFTNARQGRGKSTAYTGNLAYSDFGERYGERVMRRVQHQGVIVQIDGDDMRRRPL